LLVLLPSQLSLLHVDRLQISKGHRAGGKLAAHPLDSRLFVADKHLQLFHFYYIDPTPVVF